MNDFKIGDVVRQYRTTKRKSFIINKIDYLFSQKCYYGMMIQCNNPNYYDIEDPRTCGYENELYKIKKPNYLETL